MKQGYVPIPPEMREFLQLIARKRTFIGYTEAQVAQHILRMGFDQLITTSFIAKLIEQRDLLEGKK